MNWIVLVLIVDVIIVLNIIKVFLLSWYVIFVLIVGASIDFVIVFIFINAC